MERKKPSSKDWEVFATRWRASDHEGKVAMAIPHNGNFSRGNMYAPVDSEGKPLTAEYAAMRSRY